MPKTAGTYTLLNHPLFLFAVLAVMFAVIYLAPMLSTKADSFWTLNTNTHQAGNRKFFYLFNFMSYKGNLAADLRVYRQDNIIVKNCADKTGTFESQEFFQSMPEEQWDFILLHRPRFP